MPTQRPNRPENPFRRLADGRSLLPMESLLFVALSATDLLITYRLLWQGRFTEANPIARRIFERSNVAGLSLFKFALVGLVIVLAETTERHRPRIGRAVLILGSLAAAAAALHALGLEANQA